MDIGSVADVVSGAVVSGIAGIMLSQLSNIVRIDHPMVMNFAVAIDGFVDSGFVSCQGLHDRMQGYSITQCNQQSDRLVFPYQRKVGKVTLEKGVTFQGQMEEWYYDTVSFQRGGTSPTKDVSIMQLWRAPQNIPLLGGQLIEVRRWTLPECVCHDLTFPKYRAMAGNEISILESMIETTKPEMVERVSSWGTVGRIVDALVK